MQKEGEAGKNIPSCVTKKEEGRPLQSDRPTDWNISLSKASYFLLKPTALLF